VDMHDQGQRLRFLTSCLDQMKDAEAHIGLLTKEYSVVTSYLTDMEEIEALPSEEKKELSRIADKIAACEKEKHIYEEEKERMPEADFRRMERMGEETQEGIRKLTEAEDYQEKIRQDMRRLSGEKHAMLYRRHDLQNTLINMRGMMIIVTFSFVTCMAILLILQVLLEMDISIGYLLTVAITVLAIFLIYTKYREASREKRRVERTTNKLTLLQNRVKVRYVNNTNLLDYLYVKYGVESGGELRLLWEAYKTEKEERQKFRELYQELDFQRQELLRMLQRFRVKDPEIWLRQTQALLNRNEMVEIRHGLIVRRQKLRGQIEYNEKLADTARREVKSVVEQFPAYAAEALELVSQYEREENA